MDWFLYDNGLRHEIVKSKILKQINPTNQINDFLDLCFNKKTGQEKKRLCEISISKSIYVDTYYVLFVIILPECDECFLPYITKRLWYCECKLFKSET